MAILAVCGEDSDYDRNGSLSETISTNSLYRRSVARCVFLAYSASATMANANANFASTNLASPVTSAWLTCRAYHVGTGFVSYMMILGWGKDGKRRIGINSTATGKLSISKYDASGNQTTLVTESGTYSSGVLYKYDIQLINFGTSGTINVYRANADGSSSSLIMTYTGDLTTDSITDLNIICFQGQTNSSYPYFSEMICANTDTRGMGLVTLNPTGNGNTYSWSGSYADIDESTLNDSDLIASTTDGQIAQFTFDSSRLGTPPNIIALVLAARGQAGGGITRFTPNVRVGGVDYFGSALTPGVGLKPIRYMLTLNPSTGLPFTYSQLTTAGVNFGFRANT